MSPFNSLPPSVLDKIVRTALAASPVLQPFFLASLGSLIHSSAVRVAFGKLEIVDDARIEKSRALALLVDPERYAPSVTKLTICDPELSSDDAAAFRPLDASTLALIIQGCCSLEELVWCSAFLPPDGLCETLMLHCPRLMHFSHSPPFAIAMHQSGVSKWDALSLPLLNGLPITTLHLSRLSQSGARALTTFLTTLGEYSTIESLGVNFVWLDDQLCEAITTAGRKLRSLTIGTSGTRLTDKGVVALLEGCDSLEELVFDDVQGRLTRTLWTKPSRFPSGLKQLCILFPETGNHSWAADHLDSIHNMPLDSLSEFSIVRCDTALVDGESPTYLAADLKPIPSEFVARLGEAQDLTKFECDFWSWTIADVKSILDNCTKLESVRLCLGVPFAKLLSSTFSTNLRILKLSISPENAPGQPPVPVPPQAALPVGDSLVPRSKASTLPLDLGDPSMPLLRDVKRFVRKCPRLDLLEWYGKTGRGSWIVTRPASVTSKVSINVSIEYVPPTISPEIWSAMEEDSRRRTWPDVKREGSVWESDRAVELAATYSEEKPATKGKDTKKVRKPSISTSSSSTSDVLMPSTPLQSSPSSPIQVVSPLTPSSPEVPLGKHAYAHWRQAEEPSNHHRKRSPSEPAPRGSAKGNNRTRSNTAMTPESNSGRGKPGNSTRGRGSGSKRGSEHNSTARGRGRGQRAPAGRAKKAEV
ncbi:hypothetical protein C8J56DRAFT_1023241 [Mycena floridula]|nr:hypothetical protein C8J56DRAFT_1023241 [Mycena floridula]